MTLITPEQETAVTDDFYRSLREEVSGLRRQLEAQRERAQSGEDIDTTTASKTLQQFSDAIGRCYKVELLINDIQNKRAGIAKGGYALDLEEAAAGIRCALHRLRCTGSAG